MIQPPTSPFPTATHHPAVGACVDAGGVAYAVWAPDHRAVKVVIGANERPDRTIALERADEGYFVGRDPRGRAGDAYRFLLNEKTLAPDPASRFQPQGVSGPSVVVDPEQYVWHTPFWQPPAYFGRVIYELHVGTFTPEGTFRGAIERLGHLAALGVNTIELMPVAEFPGRCNWGYDGAMLFAPSRGYGTPDDLRALVDAAHGHGIAVILDVVYNHLGPFGNYLPMFAKSYFLEESNDWGSHLNFDGETSGPVRAFFLQNACSWIREFRIDGLRLDATHAIRDRSPRHIIAEIGEAVHALGAFAIAEDERNESAIISEDGPNAWALDGIWADDIHHSMRVALTGEQRAYFAAYRGTTAELAETLRHGWLFRGQEYAFWQRPRGTPCAHLPPERFVHCISNHDQVGNRVRGRRLNHEVAPESYRAASMLLCLSPYTPLLFMGQEWAAATPFLFFSDLPGEIGAKIKAGRTEEIRRVGLFTDASELELMPDPQSEQTFRVSQLDWTELERVPHSSMFALYRECLAWRARETIFQNPPRAKWEIESPVEGLLALRWRDEPTDWLLLVALTAAITEAPGEVEVVRPAAGRKWELVLSSNEPRFGGADVPSGAVEIPALLATGPGAWLLRENAG